MSVRTHRLTRSGDRQCRTSSNFTSSDGSAGSTPPRTSPTSQLPPITTAAKAKLGSPIPSGIASDRPEEIEGRLVPGHWEGDLILGARGASAIGTLVERTTRFVVLVHMPARKADVAASAFAGALNAIPESLRKTLTYDQGKEMAGHAGLAEATGMRIFFADPHSPWQRGANENTNGLLRQYFPKGTPLSEFDQGDLDAVADSLNARPRKTVVSQFEIRGT